MKTLVITPYYYPKIGGLENYARQLGIALHDCQNGAIVVATSNHTNRYDIVEEIDGMTIHRLGYWFKFSNTPVNPLWSIKLRRIIKQEKPDVILAHTPVPTMADAAALAHGRTPLVIFYHAATLKKGGSPVFNLIAHMYGLYESLTLGQATRIAAVSDYVREQLPSRYRSKTVVMSNAVWQKDIVSREQPTGPANFIFIGSLDRSHAWKGLDQIISAVAAYKAGYGPDVSLTVIGDGTARKDYEAQVASSGIAGNVTFKGTLTGEAKYAELQKATALICYPTTANDAFPTVILEAWAVGVPVIAAGIGPIPSLVNDGQDGFVVAPGNPPALAEKMHIVATMPTESRQSVAAAAAERTRRNYTWELLAQSVNRMVEGLQ